MTFDPTSLLFALPMVGTGLFLLFCAWTGRRFD